MDEWIRFQKEKQFKQSLMDMAAKNNDRTLMRAALSPETRVEVEGSEIKKHKDAFARELFMRLNRKKLRQLADEEGTERDIASEQSTKGSK